MMTGKFVSLLLAAIVFSACDFAGVFSSDSTQQQKQPRNNSPVDTLLSVHITGGFAGVNQLLTVDERGHAELLDSFAPRIRWETELSKPAFDNLLLLMQNNHFFDLQGPYVDGNVADAFFFDITFNFGGATKTVLTDGFTVPENLADIIDGLFALIDGIRTDSPGVSLLLDKEQMQPGDSVRMTLKISNLSATPMTLHFSDGQIFDFEARRAVGGDLVWNWAHGKAFTEALWDMTLESGESKSYGVIWNGLDNGGLAVSGDFALRATLVSNPGGRTESVKFKIGM